MAAGEGVLPTVRGGRVGRGAADTGGQAWAVSAEFVEAIWLPMFLTSSFLLIYLPSLDGGFLHLAAGAAVGSPELTLPSSRD